MGSFSRYESEKPEGSGFGSASDPWPDASNNYAQGVEGFLQSERADMPDQTSLRTMLLAKAVEYEIIPRLMLAHRFPHECSMDLPVMEQVSPEDVLEFARMVLHDDDAALQRSVMSFRARGIPMQSIFLDLLAPVARHLGELWERDLCDFTEVTMGLGRLQHVLRENSEAAAPPPTQTDANPGRRILLVPCPGEQHTFGLSLVAEFFHRAGWDVSTNFGASDVSPAVMVKQGWYDVVGFSLGSETSILRLAECIAEVRRASVNTGVPIIAGGAVFALHPEYAAQISADAIIINGGTAPEMAEKLAARNTRIGVGS
jgi:MerR family transcriptional regulator, light-induced transcriptional regulator